MLESEYFKDDIAHSAQKISCKLQHSWFVVVGQKSLTFVSITMMKMLQLAFRTVGAASRWAHVGSFLVLHQTSSMTLRVQLTGSEQPLMEEMR